MMRETKGKRRAELRLHTDVTQTFGCLDPLLILRKVANHDRAVAADPVPPNQKISFPHTDL